MKYANHSLALVFLASCSQDVTVLALETTGTTLEVASVGYVDLTDLDSSPVWLGDLDGDGSDDLGKLRTIVVDELRVGTDLDLYYGGAAPGTGLPPAPDATLRFGGVGSVLVRLGDTDGDHREELGVVLDDAEQPDQDAWPIAARAAILAGHTRFAGAVDGELLITPLAGSLDLSFAALGDLDGDGFADVGLHTSDGLAIMYGNAQGISLGTPNALLVGGVAPDVRALGDFDGDGRDDLGVTASGWFSISSFSKTTDQPSRALWGAQTRLAGTVDVNTLPILATDNHELHAIGDLDGDSRDDLAIVFDTSLMGIVKGGSRPTIATPFAMMTSARIGTLDSLQGLAPSDRFWIDEVSLANLSHTPTLVLRTRGYPRDGLSLVPASALAGDLEIGSWPAIIGTPYNTLCAGDDPDGGDPCTLREAVMGMQVTDGDGDGLDELRVRAYGGRASHAATSYGRLYTIAPAE